MASPAKADSASCPAQLPDALQLVSSAADDQALTVLIPTGAVAADPAETPPTPSTKTPPAVVVDDGAEIETVQPSPFSCHDDIQAVHAATKGTFSIDMDKLDSGCDMKYGQIRTLTETLWWEIMGKYGMNPPVAEACVLALERPSMPPHRRPRPSVHV